MDEQELKERQAICKEAISWIPTNYHHMGRVKHGGCDCGMYLLEIFEQCGLIPHIDVPYYSQTWNLHHSEELYLGWVKKYCTEVKDREPLPGDIILYQYGRCISHGSIVIDYPKIIHSYIGLGVVYGDNTQGELPKRQRAVYSFWPKKQVV